MATTWVLRNQTTASEQRALYENVDALRMQWMHCKRFVVPGKP